MVSAKWTDHPPHHTYSYEQVILFSELVLRAATSLRGASKALSLFAPHVGQLRHTAPSPNGGCNWLLRIGLYELKRPLEKADDWIWIVDHTSQVGTVRCLLIVGFRQSHWLTLQRPLEFQDLCVIALAPAKTTTAEVTEQELRIAAERTGNPRAILSDQGRDIQKAVRLFCEDHTSTSHVHDVKHKLALFLKAELEDDPQWSKFCKKLASLRKELRQTSLQFLSPPAMKIFARYMNLAEVVKWGVKTRKFLDKPTSPTSEPLNIGELNISLKLA